MNRRTGVVHHKKKILQVDILLPTRSNSLPLENLSFCGKWVNHLRQKIFLKYFYIDLNHEDVGIFLL